MNIVPIGVIRTDFSDKFGLPRQSGTAGLSGKIIFNPPFDREEAFRNLEGYSHIWIIWSFDRNPAEDKFSPTVRPPRLGGNERVGVFASRSPFRPNGLAISVVKLNRILNSSGKVSLEVEGIDMADGTPVIDVKPYVPATDSIPGAAGGYAAANADYRLKITGTEKLDVIPETKRFGIINALSQDPRPSYQEDGRRYGLFYAGFEILFSVSGNNLAIESVSPSDGNSKEDSKKD